MADYGQPGVVVAECLPAINNGKQQYEPQWIVNT